MFLGIDHGTTAMRFASGTGQFRLTREEAMRFAAADLGRLCPPDDIEGIALCYSMGDNFSKITDIKKIKNRGVVSREGAGKHIGGGTKVFDEIKKSGIPTVVIPGLHRGSRPIHGSRPTPTSPARRRSGSLLRSATIWETISSSPMQVPIP